MKREKEAALDITLLFVGEIIVSLLVIGIHFLLDLALEAKFFDFSYRVITGAALGSVVTVANYAVLTLTVNRAIKNFLTLRGTREMSEEEVIKFTQENSLQIQNVIKLSFIIRTVSIVATLVVAFLLDWFAPLATVIPLIMFRPIITVAELLKRKFVKAPEMPFEFPSAITYEADAVDTVVREISDSQDSASAENTNAEKESDD